MSECDACVRASPGDIMIIDDPLKSDEGMSESKRSRVNEWYDGTLYSRLDDKRNGVIIIIMQRLHLDDLVGYVLQKGEQWVHLNLPAIAEAPQDIAIARERVHHREAGDLLHPARESQTELITSKITLGSFNYSAQYQQRPVPAEGEIIKWHWFQTYNPLPNREPEDRIVQSWDTASKAGELNEYSVCTTWLVKGNDYFLLDVLREKLKYPELRREIVNQAQAHCATDIIIEDKGSGTSLIQDLTYESGIPRPIPFRPIGDKTTRMSAQSARVEARQVHLPARASWLDDFRTEVLQFPNGKYDDQVDSFSQFLDWIERPSGNRVWVQTWGV